MSQAEDHHEEESEGMHKSESNNTGHINNAHRHLLYLTPEGFNQSEWSKVIAAYDLLRDLRMGKGVDLTLMEQWGQAPRRYQCDSCEAEFRTKQTPSDNTDELGRANENPDHCPFCTYGTPQLVEGQADSEEEPAHD